MPTFNNMRDLEKYINGSKGQELVLNEGEIRSVLTDAAKTLERYLKDELDNYFESYSPTVYERTGDTMRSFRVSNPKKISINEWSIEIFFDENLANHPSVYDLDDGYTPWLLSAGWRTKLDSTINKEHFTRFSGSNYITKAVERFNRNNPHGLKVQVYYGNQDVTGKTYSYGK